MDLVQNIFWLFHTTLAVHHPLNLVDPYQRLVHDCSIQTQKIPTYHRRQQYYYVHIINEHYSPETYLWYISFLSINYRLRWLIIFNEIWKIFWALVTSLFSF